jgi:hypothetical protein
LFKGHGRRLRQNAANRRLSLVALVGPPAILVDREDESWDLQARALEGERNICCRFRRPLRSQSCAAEQQGQNECGGDCVAMDAH